MQSIEPAPKPHEGGEVGIDAGVNLPLALSDGNHQDHGRPPRLLDGTADRDKWLNADAELHHHHAELRAHLGRELPRCLFARLPT
ncbi:hypothetical protein ACWKT5_02255 [Streptomyces avermitilis]